MPVLPRVNGVRSGADVEKAPLVPDVIADDEDDKKTRSRYRRGWTELLIPAIVLLWLLKPAQLFEFPFPRPAPSPVPDFVKEGLRQCEIIQRPNPNPQPFTAKRKVSDRHVPGTKPTVLKNGTVWTGEKDGQEVLEGATLYLDGGVIRKIGSEKEILELVADKDADVVDLHGAWVTPGIVDMHSHMGVDPAPSLRGTADTNSLKGPALPWLRSLDGFNTHDAAFNGSIAGGITTMLVLPGSAGNIGGQAFTFKPRWTNENTPDSMQVDPPFAIHPHSNDTYVRTGAWRHIKHACGENPSRVFGNTRMDTGFEFRRAYDEGNKLKQAQDRWCASPHTQTEPFPTNLEYEVLADVIRGNVKVNIHCYETTDLNQIVRLSNTYKFPVAAFHHAHETYLVPDLLKQAYGPAPAIAIFATNARYKREAYRGSEFAPRVLADAGLNVCMKSDHPVLNSRYLVYEAAQAHHYGLNASQAIGSVTTHPARAVGLDHRLGYIRPGYDADVVVWDSYPLALGATPKQTYIDGIPQILDPHVTHKPADAQKPTQSGDYDRETAEAVQARGDPDLWPKKSASNIVFQNVEAMFLPDRVDATELKQGSTVVIANGEIACAGECAVPEGTEFETIDLKGGSITPGLITVGSWIGLMAIRQEKATWDGVSLAMSSMGISDAAGCLRPAWRVERPDRRSARARR